MQNTTTQRPAPAPHRPSPHDVRRLIQRRSYATLATVSPAGHPHAAGVLYELVDGALFVNTLAPSRKARNVMATGRVGVVIPVRRVPVGGPPSAVQFQANASVLMPDDPEIMRHVNEGKLRSITSHGELDLPESCFLRIELPRRVHTYGLGMSLVKLIRDPLGAAGMVDFGED